ncbi:hypothetical protein [Paraglaciecola polaris]|uniref:Cohesin domain-containing protein n=1 Tax=Paraglaciecola polaris LMG 21857 TaxID=1129793 RepID=K6ZXB8_9ALTE|nr:hypothetical protein [Paraglaciecola polaris]GAC33388.1 hypothetical protein GPLA_2486 [Paraglaciecola polaris LMG 21857]
MKSMKNLLLSVTLVFAALSINNANANVMLSFAPSSQVTTTGDSVSMDLMISGLMAGSADSLGTFDLDIFFDDSRLSLTSYSLTDMLGDLATEAIDDSFGEFVPGLIGISILSLLEVDELDVLQGSAFSLATFNFDVDQLEEGETTTVSVETVYALGDAFGNALLIDSIGDGVLRNPAVSASTPATFGLLILGLMIAIKRRYHIN